VSQEAPWGPIVARATTPDERVGAPVDRDGPIDERLESFA